MAHRYEKGADGIVVLMLDASDQSNNTMNPEFSDFLQASVERLEAEPGLKGVIIASAKKTFFAGGDLKRILNTVAVDDAYAQGIIDKKAVLRRLEKLPVPVVAAINGAALGGGFEICLSCHHRIALKSPAVSVGLPEVSLGLLPAAGGIVRLTALLGLERALPLLLDGSVIGARAALDLGLVDELVDAQDDLLPAARAWITSHPDAAGQPWDRDGFEYPGGGADAPHIRDFAAKRLDGVMKKTRGLLPAPLVIHRVALESMRTSIDEGMVAEVRGFCELVAGPEAKAAISTFFFGMNAIKNGTFRPKGERWKAGSGAILGAGMMGAGIAWSQANRGMKSVLKDTELAKAEKGKAYSEKLADKQISRGRMDAAGKEALLNLIRPTDKDDFDGVDIIIEAVFEDVDIKEKVTANTFGLLSPEGIFASNTSTLPISLLSKACPDPSRFIGLHFFSPVDRMKLVEIILGKDTSQDTLRKAYDYVQQIGKIPIIVNDSRGFFTTRVFGTFIDEGMALLHDGLPAADIEKAAWNVGMPVGPLAVQDEVSQTLSVRADKANKALDERLGVKDGYPVKSRVKQLIAYKLVEMGRGGRAYGGGFYDYHPDGTKTLWPGLTQFAQGTVPVTMRDAEDRILYRQVIEALRCYGEGVVTSEVEANIGSIMGIGFPAHTGGVLQFVRGVGIDRFVTRAAELAQAFGPAFEVPMAAIEKMKAADAVAA